VADMPAAAHVADSVAAVLAVDSAAAAMAAADTANPYEHSRSQKARSASAGGPFVLG
jgi:hypothetical protein